MRYHNIKKYDTANGPGIRTTIWFTGCIFNCPGCFNSEIRDFNSGEEFTEEAKATLYKYLNDPHVKGLSVLGGEPLAQKEELLELLKEVKEKAPGKDIWMWTGYELDKLIDKKLELPLEMLTYVDYLVDGPFIEAESHTHHRFRGSANQKIWDIRNGVENRKDVSAEFDSAL